MDVYSSFSHVDNRGESVNLSYTTKKRNMVEFKEFHQFEDQGVNFLIYADFNFHKVVICIFAEINMSITFCILPF